MEAPEVAEHAGKEGPGHEVVVSVNNRPVSLMGPRISGLAIKQAAMEAGLPVQLDFVLTQELANDQLQIIGDGDTVTVNRNSKFLMAAPDDNS